MAQTGGITIRVRSQLGMWRLRDVNPADAVEALVQRIEAEKNVPAHQQTLSLDAGGTMPLDASVPLAKYGIKANGDVVHLRIDAHADALIAGPAMVTKKKIGADGSIVAVQYEEAQAERGFRPGMPRLRDMKKTWTLQEFVEMNEQFVYRFEKPKEGEADEGRKSEMCFGAHVHSGCMMDFTTAMQQVGWNQCRVAYLYGTFDEGGGEGGGGGGGGGGGEDEGSRTVVKIEAMYEPPQENTPEGFEVLEDPREEQVAKLAEMLNLKKVGWIFAHPPREEGFLMSAEEVMFAALQQLEAADGVNKTPFVTLHMTPTAEGAGHTDAQQVTLTAMDMVAEGALEVNPANRATCAVSDTFTAVVEGREGVKTVETERFLLNVPVMQNEKPMLQNKVFFFSFCSLIVPANLHAYQHSPGGHNIFFLATVDIYRLDPLIAPSHDLSNRTQ